MVRIVFFAELSRWVLKFIQNDGMSFCMFLHEHMFVASTNTRTIIYVAFIALTLRNVNTRLMLYSFLQYVR